MAKHDRKLAAGQNIPNRAKLNRNVILVTWDDHASLSEWLKSHELEQRCKERTIVTSVGFPIYTDDDAIVLAQSVGGDSVADCIRILKCAIVSVKSPSGKNIEYRKLKRTN